VYAYTRELPDPDLTILRSHAETLAVCLSSRTACPTTWYLAAATEQQPLVEHDRATKGLRAAANPVRVIRARSVSLVSLRAEPAYHQRDQPSSVRVVAEPEAVSVLLVHLITPLCSKSCHCI
jgi:hypothetical protein